MPHIAVRNLSVNYGAHPALRDVSVDMPDGQITVVLGPSGCGKSTLLKSLNRLTDLHEDVSVRGQVLIDGADIHAAGTDVLVLRKKVGFLSQRPFPLPMSIADNVFFGPKIHRLTPEQMLRQIGRVPEEIARRDGAAPLLVKHYLEMAGLWDEVKDRLHAPAADLSVGQQQRLALARALAVEPEVILADEPTSALDPISAQLIEKRFQTLRGKYTIVLVTHILRQARRLADYVVFLYLGEVVEHGPAAEFFRAPRDPRTRAYLAGEIS